MAARPKKKSCPQFYIPGDTTVKVVYDRDWYNDLLLCAAKRGVAEDGGEQGDCAGAAGGHGRSRLLRGNQCAQSVRSLRAIQLGGGDIQQQRFPRITVGRGFDAV